MSNPKVTITLGRTGPKVVKRPRYASRGARNDCQPLSGRTRSIRERFDGEADTSLLSTDKRRRLHLVTRSPTYNGVGDARLAPNDLRLKLMRKRISMRIQHEVWETKKMELREKMLRTIRGQEGAENGILRHTKPTTTNSEFPKMDSFRRYHSSQTVERLVQQSSVRVPPQASLRTSPPRIIKEVQQTSFRRQIDSSRIAGLLGDPYRPEGPAGITMTAIPDADKRVTELPTASTAMQKSSYLREQSHTVRSLLQSLGLEKYVVQFLAEEVDMTALNQMKDSDLKELGIPMGPRKKILLAILPHPRKQ